MTWPVLRPPPARWVRSWRAAVVVVTAAALALVGRHVVLGGLPAWGWIMAAVGVLYVGRASFLVWRRVAEPRLTRSDARSLNPVEGADEREALHKRLRLTVKERRPLQPDLHHAAALAVAHSTRTQPWYPAIVGLFGLLVIAVTGPGSSMSDPFNLLVYAFTAVCYLPMFTDEQRIRRAAEAADALPAQVPDSGVEMP